MENNNLKSLQEIFDNRIFRIPDYQRGYAWTVDELRKFWDDLVNLPEEKDHYFGMLTLREIENIKTNQSWNDERWTVEDLDYKAMYIVDGQQRLTTTIIMISAIIDCCNKNNIGILSSTKIEDIEEHYLWLTRPTNMYKTYVFGYEKNNPSNDFFRARILGQGNDSERSEALETYYTLNLENAKEFFKDKIETLYEKGKTLALEKIYRKLTQKMKMNIYNISDDFSVYVTFESMNNRGRRLTVLELLKNRLIYLNTLITDKDSNESYLREKINNAWKDIYEYLGKDKLRPLEDDKYLRDHWIIYFGYQAKKEKNYENFLLNEYFSRKRVAGYDSETGDILDSDKLGLDGYELNRENLYSKNLTAKEIQEYVESIQRMAKYWYALYSPDDTTVIKNNELRKTLKKINRLGHEYFTPLLMVILAKDLTDEQKLTAFRAIERYIFLYFRLAGNISSSNRPQFYKLAREFNYDRVTFEEVLESLADVECVQNGVLRTDLVYAKNFQNLFDRHDGHGYYSWQTLKYFLYEYEISLKDKNRAAMKVDPTEFFKTGDKDKISIEHIYPQTPQGTWLEKPFDEYSDEEKKHLTNTLGNLLLLSQAVNSSAQNKDFNEKRERYLENSHSAVDVATIEDEEGKLQVREAWTPEAIKERGVQMLNFMAAHYGFKFRNEYDMLKLLGLTFMAEEDEESWEDFEAEYNADGATSSNVINVLSRHDTGTNDAENHSGTKAPHLKRRKITPEVVQEAYTKAKEVHDGKTDIDTALDYLEQFGNRNSMNMYIYAFEAMLTGKNYTMNINPYALEYYVEHILADYGEGCRENIIKTLKERVKRYKGERLRIKEEDMLEKLGA